METPESVKIVMASILSSVVATVVTYTTVMHTISDEVDALKEPNISVVDTIPKESGPIEYKPFIDIEPILYNTHNVRSSNYADDEIRDLREKQSFKEDGSYIYTPMRSIPSKEKQIEKEVEKYIDKHGDRLYEELEDKYGN